ncbi:MAG: hypothetical protein K2Y20_09460 [Sphingomonas sp.]|nr:hypothetical protein [Sphingomonas sp.]
MWLQLGGSLVAVLALAGLTWLLKLGRAPPIVDAAFAVHEAEAMLSGFEAREAIVAADGETALVHGRDDSVAVLKRHGAHFVARRVRADAVRETPEGWQVDTGEALFGPVLVRR